MSRLYSHTCKKPCEMLARIKCDKPCQIYMESDAIINLEDLTSEEEEKMEEELKIRQLREEQLAREKALKEKALKEALIEEEKKKEELRRKAEKKPAKEYPSVIEPPIVKPQIRPIALTNSCMTITGYDNRENSCYLDSTLFALFAFESKFIRSEILNVPDDVLYDRIFSSKLIRNEADINKVFKYVKKIRGLLNEVFLRIKPKSGTEKEKSCVNLRNELLKSPLEILNAKPNKFWASRQQQDSSEFLICIMNTFFITNIVSKTETTNINTVLNYKDIPSSDIKLVSPIIQINISNIRSLEEFFLLSERTILEPLEELIASTDVNKPETIRYKKIKLMYRIFNLLVGFSKKPEKFRIETEKLYRKDSNYRKILDRLKLIGAQYDNVDDIDFEDMKKLYNDAIENITAAKGYTSELITTLNLISKDKTKGHYKTHQELLSKVRYFNEIEKKTEYLFKKEIDPYLVISLSRFGDGGRKNRKPIDFNDSIVIDGVKLQLNAVIIHSGTTIEAGHYVCAFRCNNNWYLYNDIPSSTITKIGSFRDLQNYKLGITSCREDANIFIYSLAEPIV